MLPITVSVIDDVALLASRSDHRKGVTADDINPGSHSKDTATAPRAAHPVELVSSDSPWSPQTGQTNEAKCMLWHEATELEATMTIISYRPSNDPCKGTSFAQPACNYAPVSRRSTASIAAYPARRCSATLQ